MRLAVLLTGSPRFVPHGAKWWFNHAMPKNVEIDYYGHCWNNHDPIGSKRYYDKDTIEINENYFECWPFTDFKLTDYTTDLDCYDGVRKDNTLLKRHLLWEDRRDITISAHYANEMLLKHKKEYDLVLIMRYDVIIKPKTLDKVLPFVLHYKSKTNKFHKGQDKALYYNDNNPCIFTPWVQVRQGLPVMQDYMFLCTYKDWLTYTGGNLYEQYKRLLTKDKAYLDPTNFVDTIYHQHVFWAFIGLYSKANFIANNDLGAVALREDIDVDAVSYEQIVDIHDKHFL